MVIWWRGVCFLLSMSLSPSLWLPPSPCPSLLLVFFFLLWQFFSWQPACDWERGEGWGEGGWGGDREEGVTVDPGTQRPSLWITVICQTMAQASSNNLPNESLQGISLFLYEIIRPFCCNWKVFNSALYTELGLPDSLGIMIGWLVASNSRSPQNDPNVLRWTAVRCNTWITSK